MGVRLRILIFAILVELLQRLSCGAKGLVEAKLIWRVGAADSDLVLCLAKTLHFRRINDLERTCPARLSL